VLHLFGVMHHQCGYSARAAEPDFAGPSRGRGTKKIFWPGLWMFGLCSRVRAHRPQHEHRQSRHRAPGRLACLLIGPTRPDGVW
jgi:hypothetical protein